MIPETREINSRILFQQFHEIIPAVIPETHGINSRINSRLAAGTFFCPAPTSPPLRGARGARINLELMELESHPN